MAKLFAWGSNNQGQLGLGDTSTRSSPVQVGSLTNWTDATGGDGVSLALKDDGTLWQWGNNQTTPVQIGSDTDWTLIASGKYHRLAIKSDGSLWAWGNNDYGQLGLGDTNSRSGPTQVGSDTDWVFIDCGFNYSFAIKSNGTLWACGSGGYYCLGLGDSSNRSSLTQVGNATNWSAVSGGDHHSMGLKSDGTLWAWGDNEYGQLGIGNTTNQSSPVQVGTLTDWDHISCGMYSSYGIRSNGTLWSCGSNSNGELGLGDTSDRHSPTQVNSSVDWIHIEGAQHLYAGGIKFDCTLWTWGYNSSGQLGLGDGDPRQTPCQVGSSTEWDKIAGCYDYTLGLTYSYPRIYSGLIAEDNSYCKIEVTQLIYSDVDTSQTITKDDFILSFSQNGGNITSVNIEGLYEDAALTTPLVSGTGYSTFYVKLDFIGKPKGVETIEIKPASSSAIYAAGGTAMPDSETTGVLTLNEAFQIVSFDGKVRVVLSTLDSFNGKVAVNTPTNLFDGKAKIKDTAVEEFDGRVDVNTITDSLDGKGRIKNFAINTLDGLLDIKDTTSVFLDGKARVRSSAVNFLDGKVYLFCRTINLLDGKIHPIYRVANGLDGKIAPTDRLGNLNAYAPLPTTVFKLGGQVINDIPCIDSTLLGVFRYARMQASLFPFSFHALTGSVISENVPGFVSNIIGTNPQVGIINGYLKPLYGTFRIGAGIESKVDLYGCEIYADVANVSKLNGFIPGVISLSLGDSEDVARILGSIVSPNGSFGGLTGNVGKVYGRIPYLLQIIEAKPGIISSIIGEASSIGATITASRSGDIIIISDIPGIKWYSSIGIGVKCVILKYVRSV